MQYAFLLKNKTKIKYTFKQIAVIKILGVLAR